MRKTLLACFCLLLPALPAFASTVSDKQKEINELEARISSLQAQARTLTGQIAYYDGQIRLAGLKIAQTEELVSSISTKISLLETHLQKRAGLLQKQIFQTYKAGQIDPLTLFFASRDFASAMTKFKYFQVLQAQNRKLLHDTQLVQSQYGQQKQLLVESQKRLELQKQTLDSLRREKDNLLTQTKNDEAVFQKQLEQARLELEALEKALAAAVREGPVKKGDPIAIMGNSGYPSCSTGPHLHFEVRLNDTWVNAEGYLKNITDKLGLSIGSGSWDWPMKGLIEITQRYGKTEFSYRYVYSGGIHTGIDLVSSEKVIFAVADGTLYAYTGKCGSSDLKIKYIDHGNNLKTFYLHIQ